MLTRLWPRRSETILGWMPWPRSSVAQVVESYAWKVSFRQKRLEGAAPQIRILDWPAKLLGEHKVAVTPVGTLHQAFRGLVDSVTPCRSGRGRSSCRSQTPRPSKRRGG